MQNSHICREPISVGTALPRAFQLAFKMCSLSLIFLFVCLFQYHQSVLEVGSLYFINASSYGIGALLIGLVTDKLVSLLNRLQQYEHVVPKCMSVTAPDLK